MAVCPPPHEMYTVPHPYRELTLLVCGGVSRRAPLPPVLLPPVLSRPTPTTLCLALRRFKICFLCPMNQDSILSNAILTVCTNCLAL